MKLDKDINISIKGVDGKYKTIISIKQGEYGIQVGVARERLVELLKSEAPWINLYPFFNEPKEQAPVADSAPPELNDEIPF